MSKIIYILGTIVFVAGCIGLWFASRIAAPVVALLSVDEGVMCTMDAMQCPDGSYIGRTGPTCEFVCPKLPDVPDVTQAAILAKADMITLASPVPLGLIEDGVTVSGQARGNWYFEGSFPVELTNSTGTVIAQGVATAQGEWMTTDFVPFTATLQFQNPYVGGPDDSQKYGTLRLKKDNPSGSSEYDDSLEIPVRFAP